MRRERIALQWAHENDSRWASAATGKSDGEDPASDDSTAGGCNAGGGNAGLLLMFLGALLVAVRRRTTC